MKAHQWTALIGSSLGTAIILLAFPIFIDAFITLKAALSESSLTGSPIYEIDRALRLERGILGTTAYAILCIATIGLIGTAAARIKFRKALLSLFWLLAVAGALGLMEVVSPRIVESTDANFKLIYIGGPQLMILLATIALILLPFHKHP